MKLKNDLIVGNITIKNNIYDFKIENGFIKVINRVNYKVKKEIKIDLNIMRKHDEIDFVKYLKKSLLDNFKTLIETDIQIVPTKFLFNKQKTTDMMIIGKEEGKRKIVLARRKYPPVGWGLFGGMVEKDENFETNREKELEEEANLTDKYEVHTVGEFELDEIRGDLITSLALIDVGERLSTLKAGDDVLEIKKLTFKEVRELLSTNELVPHHKYLIQEGIKYFEKNIKKKEKGNSNSKVIAP